MSTYQLPKTIISAIEAEVDNARHKFPANKRLTVALMEEVGELAQAQLQGQDRAHVVAEAVQVIATAVRVIEEGDADLMEVIKPIAREAVKPRLNVADLKLAFASAAPRICYLRTADAVKASITVEGEAYSVSVGADPLEAVHEAHICRALWDEVRTKYYA